MPILFPEYRDFEEYREGANNNLIAVFVSSHIGASSIASVRDDSGRRLPDIFNNVKDIKRFNVTPKEALLQIQSSEHTLVSMSIVQTLSVYEVFIKAAARMLLENGYQDPNVKLKNLEHLKIGMVTEFVRANCGIRRDDINWQLYNYVRNIRNRITHAFGEADASIDYATLPVKARTEWEKQAGRPLLDAINNNFLVLQVGELYAVLSIAYRAGTRINERLAKKLGKRYWAQVAIEDFIAKHRKNNIRTVPFKKVQTYVAMHYGSIKLSNQVLKSAIHKSAIKQ